MKWRKANGDDTLRFDSDAVFSAGIRNHHISNTAYPIQHNSTWAPYRTPRSAHREMIQKAWSGIDDLLLYAHIPFCEKRCYYCEYTVVGPDELERQRDYMELLFSEIDFYAKLLDTKTRTVHGFDIGGGTPTFVDAALIRELVARATSNFSLRRDTQISIETTPLIAANEPGKLRDLHAAGIDRISMGVQVTQPDLLRVLNRDTNGAEHHRQAIDNIRSAGFRNLNIDVMYGFAGQTLDGVRATLDHVLSLEPEAITLYRMRYKLTRVSHQASQVQLEDVHAQANLARKMLLQAGYFANPGKTTYSRFPDDSGTSDYIERRVIRGMPYLGLGLGAQSYSDTTISYNDGAAAKSIPAYEASLKAGRPPIQDLYDLPREHMMAKMIAVSFYFGEINRKFFQGKFGISLEEAYAEQVDFVLKQGLMAYNGDCLSLTESGAHSYNGIIALFHAPSIQKYLLERDPEDARDFVRNQKMALAVAERAGAT